MRKEDEKKRERRQLSFIYLFNTFSSLRNVYWKAGKNKLIPRQLELVQDEEAVAMEPEHKSFSNWEKEMNFVFPP